MYIYVKTNVCDCVCIYICACIYMYVRTQTPHTHHCQTHTRIILPTKKKPTTQESSIIWAHWLIRTYTLGALDTKRVALVTRLESLLAQLPASNPDTTLPSLIEEAGIAHLNIFVSPALAAEAEGVCRALAKAGHTLGLETAAGAFSMWFSCMGWGGAV